MDIRMTIQFINLILATASIVPSCMVLVKLIKERKLVAIEDRKLNKALTIIFGGIVVLALTNATVSLLAILDVGRFAHYFSPLGRLITNTFFSVASWLIYFVDKELERS